MISYLGSLVQFSPATGRAGRCRQHCVWVALSVFLATLGLPRSRVSVLSLPTLLRLPAALYGAGPALRAVPVFGYSTKARIRLCLRFVPSLARAAQAARGLTSALSLGATRPFPSEAPASVSARPGWVPAACAEKTGGRFAVWEGVPSLGLSLPLSPPSCLLPPAGMGRSAAG